MHKLLHAWGHNQLTAEEQSKYSQAAFRLVVEAIEGCSRAPDGKLRLVLHVMGSFAALSGASDRTNGITEDVVDEVAGVGGFMTDVGLWPETRTSEEYVWQARRRLLGVDDPDTITAMSNLAVTLGQQGCLEEAALMQKEVLVKRQLILGEDHPDTISAMNNLAVTLGDQGQLDEAAKMKKEVLEKMTRVLGEEHPDTKVAAQNLAIPVRRQKKRSLLRFLRIKPRK
ncbi:hypothetical protein T440DRAFT_473548 [Plenodomus tracheiphilus IPT5]|uniref:TPR-like protein n=1 Tax=Plenodomus tracheiphilus IPT5 TaxID=1408161 RepID=A0A6A7AM71_9PLEO|nr:hypothetical protein T440DRAFT_473548 [Plenodomus tracheiphilus IPT5]